MEGFVDEKKEERETKTQKEEYVFSPYQWNSKQIIQLATKSRRRREKSHISVWEPENCPKNSSRVQNKKAQMNREGGESPEPFVLNSKAFSGTIFKS